jgi:hypothetical protein
MTNLFCILIAISVVVGYVFIAALVTVCILKFSNASYDTASGFGVTWPFFALLAPFAIIGGLTLLGLSAFYTLLCRAVGLDPDIEKLRRDD